MKSTFTFKCMYLADTFIQSDLQCVQAIHFFCQYVDVSKSIKSGGAREEWALVDAWEKRAFEGAREERALKGALESRTLETQAL